MKLRQNGLLGVLLTGLATFLTAFFLMVLPGLMPVADAATATPQQAQSLHTFEDTLFGTHYDHESLEVRVARIEETVFGQVQTGPVDARLGKLKSALSGNNLGPLSPKTTANSPSGAKTTANSTGKGKRAPAGVTTQSLPKGNAPASATSQPNPAAKPVVVAPSAGETDYPTVSQMEQKVFGKQYATEDVTVRLARLEKEIFKVPQTGGLADRVDNLRMVVLGDTGNAQAAANTYPMANAGANSGYPQSPGPNQAYSPPQYGQLPAGGSNYNTGYPSNVQYGGGYANPAYGNNPYGMNPSYPGTQVSSASGVNTGQPYYGQPAGGNYQSPAYAGQPGAYSTAYQPGPGGMGNGQASPDMIAAMDEVEKQVLGHTYPSEPINGRLDRLETKVFHTTSPELPAQDRMQRVIAVASAGGAPSTPQAKAKSAFQNLLPIILTILPLILL